MANHPSAKKRYRQSLNRRARNRHWRSTVRHAVRRVRQGAAEAAPDLAERFQRAEKLLRKASSKGVFHQRTVSRTVSRLSRLVGRAG
ncbi:MAG: 30S ribosomal protein S20 [Myxococcota bacterium]